MRALVLAVSAKFGTSEAAKTFRFLASLGVRLLTASSTRSASVEMPLAETARRVYSGELLSVESIKQELEEIAPSDEAFEEAMKTLKVSNARLARYFLRSLELANSSDAEPYFIPNDEEVINLEHVLPKRPDGQWQNWTEGERRANVSRLGNQALMRASDNSHIKSSDFSEKRGSFAKSPYTLTSQIAEVDNWTPADVQARQETLAALAPAAWPI